ncbi:MAG: DUF5916 domain-containing protein [Calditrichia bacterium]
MTSGRMLPIVILLLLTSLIFAQTENKIHLTIPKINSKIHIDGKMDEPQWKKALKVTAFSEVYPADNGKPAVETEAYLMYDEDNLYLGFKAYDNPDELRYSLTERDGIFSDDFVGIIFDTYGNTTWGYEIFSNPIGIQADLKRTSNREDPSFDIIFYSDGRIIDDGYMVEMAIPFKSLRFPNKENQQWLVTFLRIRPRDSRYQYFFPALERGNPCMFCQAVVLDGINGIQPGRNIELIPAFTGNKSATINDYDDPESGLNHEDIKGQLSFSGKLSLNSNSSVELTVNPDFSQVESDADQIDVNTTFALWYPERRPFFQEGSDIYRSFFNLVYTRSINDPIAAAKFTTRRGKWDVAYLGARDEKSPILIPLEESTEFIGNGVSYSNVLRIKRSFGSDSYWGILLSDRRYEEDAFNTVVSIDLKYLFWKNFRFEFQYFKTFTDEMLDSTTIEDYGDQQFGYDQHTVAFDDEKFSGHGFYTSLEFENESWEFNADYMESSPEVRADNGFIFQNNYRRAVVDIERILYPKMKLIDRIVPMINIARVWNFDGIRKDEWFTPAVFIQMKGQTNLNVRVLWSGERFQDKDFKGIRRIHYSLNTRFSDKLGGGFYGGYGTSIARTLDDPVLGILNEAGAWLNIKLMNKLFVSPEINYFNMTYRNSNDIIYDGYILRVWTKYQFNKELYLRLVTQFNKFNRELSIEPLLTYKLNPFTIMYIGYGGSQRDYKEPYGWKATSRQVFFKLQYLWQV